jgi:membrane protease YdiL (CAAX protease family)
MSRTRPSTSSKEIRSPIRIGWEIASCTPATMFAIVCWAAKPMIAASTAVEARMPVAMRLNSVNWLSAIATKTKKTTKNSSRRRKRRRVRVDRETCETGGVMKPKLAFPYATWGPQLAIGGVFLALGTGILLGIPAVIVDGPGDGDLSSAANIVVQLATALGFLLVPIAIASRWGESPVGQALGRLGVRSFSPSALKWMLAAIGAYLLFAAVYTAIFGSPHQEDIADSFGSVPVQILLIVIAAPVSEEICFRGMVFGGLRTRLPRLAAALISAIVFGGLHALTGISAVPPLIAFGFVLALLYEKTGSIVPGIVLHMLNNSVALIGQ